MSVESTTTAADGTYTFGTVGSGDYDLEFTATAYDTEWFDNAASAADGSVTVESGQERTGHDRQRGVAAVSATGTYMFGTVGSGDYDLEFTAADYDTEWFDNAASAADGSVTVESGQATANAALLLSLLPPGSITGTVTTDDVSADPIEGATVTLYEDGGIVSVESTTTAADGTYMFGTVGSGDYDLEFTATGYDTEWFDNAASAADGSLTVGSGQATIANAALLLSLNRIWAASRVRSPTTRGRCPA